MGDPTTRGRATTNGDWLGQEIALLDQALARVDRELATARREAAAAALATRRYRGRRAIRIANRIHEQARPLAHVLPGRRAAAGSGPTLPPAPRAGTPDPAAFRGSFLAALDVPGRLRVEVSSAAGGDTNAAERATRWIAENGWSQLAAAGGTARTDAGPAAAPSVVLVTDPGADLHAARRGPVLVAVVTDPAAWAGCDWLDDVDIVATPDEATAAAVGARRAIVPQVIQTGADLVATLRRWATGLRVGIAVGIPSWSVAKAWGDLHFARDVQRQLERRGTATRVHLLPDWADAVAARDDVVIHVFGLSVRQPLPGQRTILWNISHPERMTPAMLDAADRVYVASDLAATRFATQTSTPVAPLHQATDPERFAIERSGPAHHVLFVGNTRGVRRTAVEWLVPTEFDLAIYGAGWEKQPDAAPYVRGQHVPNDDVHRWYGSARILLNDHWPDMREQGFISNRLYDGLAAGAFIVTDDVPGLREEFDDGLVAVASGGELRWAIHDALADEPRRRATAERGRRAVLDRHTFGHRVETILADLRGDTGRGIEASRVADAGARDGLGVAAG